MTIRKIISFLLSVTIFLSQISSASGSLQGVEYAVAGAVGGPLGIATKFALQESTAYAIDETVERSSNQAAQLITQCEILQKEFAHTIKFCAYAGLCAGSVKASKKFVSSLTKNAAASGEARGIIKESEMVQRALLAPTEWNGQFKLVREIQPVARSTEFASEIYFREVVFKDPKTQQMFRAFQRNDIDPNYVVGLNRKTGLQETNLDLMRIGRSPFTSNGEQVIIHHIGQSAYGPFVEVTKTTHRPFLHNQFGARQPHPTAPVVRSEFDSIREAYWKAYAESFK